MGRVIHKDMKGGLGGGGSPATLTAFVLISMLEAGVDKDVSMEDDLFLVADHHIRFCVCLSIPLSVFKSTSLKSVMLSRQSVLLSTQSVMFSRQSVMLSRHFAMLSQTVCHFVSDSPSYCPDRWLSRQSVDVV